MHPLLQKKYKHNRGLLRNFIGKNISTLSHSNILFVCGGNKDKHLRPRFKAFIEDAHSEYLVLFPEHALQHQIGRDSFRYVDLADFEKLIGEVCCAIVIFPEAPGSIAELGMFSAIEHLAKKTLAVLNFKRQGKDSFISLGPVGLIDSISDFKSCIQLNYDDPDFDLIVGRIKERKTAHYNRYYSFKLDRWENLTHYNKFVVIVAIISFARLCSIEDIRLLVQSVTLSKPPRAEIRDICLVLLGCELISTHVHDEEDLFYPISDGAAFYKVNDGVDEEYAEAIDAIQETIQGDASFRAVFREVFP